MTLTPPLNIPRSGAGFTVRYHYLVVEDDIPELSSVWQEEIRRAIELKLTTKPDLYGKPLRRSLKGYRQLRVGDYRVIYRIEGTAVKIFVIQHRSQAYRSTERRI